jgi:hypothetical protein
MTETAIVEATRRLEQFNKEEILRRQQWEARVASLGALRTPLMMAGAMLAAGIGASIVCRWMRR